MTGRQHHSLAISHKFRGTVQAGWNQCITSWLVRCPLYLVGAYLGNRVASTSSSGTGPSDSVRVSVASRPIDIVATG
jgi:hypothetical protein